MHVLGIVARVPELKLLLLLPLPSTAAVETAVISPCEFTVMTGTSVELPNVPVDEFTVARSMSVRDDAGLFAAEKAVEKFTVGSCTRAEELLSTV